MIHMKRIDSLPIQRVHSRAVVIEENGQSVQYFSSVTTIQTKNKLFGLNIAGKKISSGFLGVGIDAALVVTPPTHYSISHPSHATDFEEEKKDFSFRGLFPGKRERESLMRRSKSARAVRERFERHFGFHRGKYSRGK